MKKITTLALILALTLTLTTAQAAEKAFKLTPEWSAKIEKIAPEKPTVKPAEPRKALLFSKMTGYQHWVTPHTAEVVKILGKKTGAFEVVASDDVAMFEPEKIKQFDVIILNNNCSNRAHRNIFLDVTKDEKKAAALEKSLLDHIKKGNGLVNIHGAITMLNNSPEASKMMGGSFDFHPAQQEVVCELVDPKHPLVAAFGGKTFVHIDEPYLFKGAYDAMDFRPLLEMNTDKLNCGKRTEAVRSKKRYTAWIKKYSDGRVFYCSPSHNAQSFERPELLQFLLDGIQYTAGDLKCDDSPMKKK